MTHGDMCSAALYCGLSFIFWVFRSGFVSEHVCAHDIPVFGTLTVLRRDEDRQRGGQGAEGSRGAAQRGQAWVERRAVRAASRRGDSKR